MALGLWRYTASESDFMDYAYAVLILLGKTSRHTWSIHPPHRRLYWPCHCLLSSVSNLFTIVPARLPFYTTVYFVHFTYDLYDRKNIPQATGRAQKS